jgi:hypothetical protein
VSLGPHTTFYSTFGFFWLTERVVEPTPRCARDSIPDALVVLGALWKSEESTLLMDLETRERRPSKTLTSHSRAIRFNSISLHSERRRHVSNVFPVIGGTCARSSKVSRPLLRPPLSKVQSLCIESVTASKVVVQHADAVLTCLSCNSSYTFGSQPCSAGQPSTIWLVDNQF